MPIDKTLWEFMYLVFTHTQKKGEGGLGDTHKETRESEEKEKKKKV